MKNINIPPHITLILGIILIVISSFLVEIDEIVFYFILFLGIVLTTIGVAGLAIELFGKRVRIILTSDVSEFKFSRYVAYISSVALLITLASCFYFEKINFAILPVTLLFLLSLAFNGGLGGRNIKERLPFYLAATGFIIFLIALLIT